MPLVFALSILIGVSLGLLGGGGSILTVPILVYGGVMSPPAAIASSLFVVGATSTTSVISHARAGRVRWRTGAIFGAAGVDIDWAVTAGVTAAAVAGSYVGAGLAGRVPPAALRRGFGAFLVAMAALVLVKELA